MKRKRRFTTQAVVGNLLLVLSCLFMAAVASATDRTVYYHTDFLGSVVAATDESGALLWRESYRPFGERIDREVSTKENTPFYTGKPHDDDTGLSYFGARDYDPMVGRFLGIDPVGVDPANLHSFNRYAYANNNPYKYVDPDGRLPVLAVFVVKELVSIAIEQSTGVSVPISVGGALKGAAKHNAKKQAAKIASSKKGAREAAKSAGGAANSAQGALLREHLRQAEKYGKGGIKELSNGRTRYYGEMVPANKAGEMAGRRTVREWDPVSGNKRTWHETLDRSGNVRQVRPELNGGSKTHYTFDKSGNYTGSW